MEWQTIETAPTGTLVLAYYRGGAMAVRRIGKNGQAYDVLRNPCGAPTHWMPLPEPPK